MMSAPMAERLAQARVEGAGQPRDAREAHDAMHAMVERDLARPVAACRPPMTRTSISS
jgi:hypothetical protein